MKERQGIGFVGMAALGLLAACAQDSQLAGSDCEEGQACSDRASLRPIDAVDILLVIDSSASITPAAEKLKAELPRMMNAIVTGSDETTMFPPASSVHVAVTTSDLGAEGVASCEGSGDDGVFLRPGEVGVTCDTSFPGFLAYDRGPAALATVDTVSCLPLVGTDGCGFEQHLEAGLKALWPASDTRVAFAAGQGHGEDANAGFLREDSLLVVIVVTDEDDCSAEDLSLYSVDPSHPLATQPVNVRCAFNPDAVHGVARYAEGFKTLRPDNDHVIFAAIGGVPPELVAEDAVSQFDLTSPEGAVAYFDMVLNEPAMQPALEGDPNSPTARVASSCTSGDVRAEPPVRLVETAAAFGTQGVLGSLCSEDFGQTTGQIIRTIGSRLTEAAVPQD